MATAAFAGDKIASIATLGLNGVMSLFDKDNKVSEKMVHPVGKTARRDRRSKEDKDYRREYKHRSAHDTGDHAARDKPSAPTDDQVHLRIQGEMLAEALRHQGPAERTTTTLERMPIDLVVGACRHGLTCGVSRVRLLHGA